VLIHGWGMNRQIWQGVIEHLPSEVAARVVALDMPGYGDNQVGEIEMNFDGLVSWLEEQVTVPSILIGWSLGGLVAQRLAIKSPEKVIQLGLVATTPHFVQRADWPGIKPQVLAMFAKQLSQDHASLIDKFMAIQAMGSETAKQDIRKIKHWVLSKPTPASNVLAAGLNMLETIDLRSDLKYLPENTHVLLGKLDSLVPVKAAEQILDSKPNLNVTVVDKASHAPFISHPQEFTKWLLNMGNED